MDALHLSILHTRYSGSIGIVVPEKKEGATMARPI